MAISLSTSGSAANGTTSAAVPHPASIVAGNLLVLAVANKYTGSIPSTPAGWTAYTSSRNGGGMGANGIDVGNAQVTVFTKIADGTETGNLTVTVTGGNVTLGRMFQISNNSGSWNIGFCSGSRSVSGTGTNPGTAWSASMSASFNPEIKAGDAVLVFSGINTDGTTYTNQWVSASGISSWGTAVEIQDSGTTSGQDCGLLVSFHTALAGTSSNSQIVYSATANTSGTNFPAGGSVLMRIREFAPDAGFDPFGMFGYFGL